MPLTRNIPIAVLLLAALPSRAEEVVYGPDGAPTVVQRKLHAVTGRWEAVAMLDAAINTALIDQYGGVLGVAYHPSEWLDVGAEALLHRTWLSALAVNVRSHLPARTPSSNHCSATPYTGCKDEFANDNQLRYGAFGVARLAPIYGKFNLASELSVHFQAFLLGGAGVASVHRESINLCAVAGTDTGTQDQCPAFQSSNAVKGVGLVGGGFRFYFGRTVSLRTEVRGYFFPSSYKETNDLTDPATGTARSYLAVVATFASGLSFLF
ncbi:MAG: outer membrane beta-barrel domain-containing protein [Myxococcales bacterium]|nr:outer membrane beta-barrel domain-containing protein [Myxococcales bacterium]